MLAALSSVYKPNDQSPRITTGRLLGSIICCFFCISVPVMKPPEQPRWWLTWRLPSTDAKHQFLITYLTPQWQHRLSMMGHHAIHHETERPFSNTQRGWSASLRQATQVLLNCWWRTAHGTSRNYCSDFLVGFCHIWTRKIFCQEAGIRRVESYYEGHWLTWQENLDEYNFQY